MSDETEDKISDDSKAFEEAMRGVRRIEGAKRLAPGDDDPGTGHIIRLAGKTMRGRAIEAAVRAVPGASHGQDASAPVSGHDETAGEPWQIRAAGVDGRGMKRLRAGDFPVEARLDLHGLTRDRASQVLARFLTAARAGHRRGLLIIHGRGLHSGPDGPALKEVVRATLSRGEFAAAILAAASAPAGMGGEGATVVWLRKS